MVPPLRIPGYSNYGFALARMAHDESLDDSDLDASAVIAGDLQAALDVSALVVEDLRRRRNAAESQRDSQSENPPDGSFRQLVLKRKTSPNQQDRTLPKRGSLSCGIENVDLALVFTRSKPAQVNVEVEWRHPQTAL